MKPNIEYLTVDGHLSDESSALMAEALSGNRIPDVPGVVLSHLEECIECKDKILDVVSFLRNPDTPMILKPSRHITQPWYFYRGKIAAVFVVFALLISVFYYDSRNPSILKSSEETPSGSELAKKDRNSTSPAHTSEHNSNTVQKQGETTEPAIPNLETQFGSASFDVNPNLESMIGGQLRGTSMKAFTPANNSVLKPPVHFSWTKEIITPYTLKIVSNKNNTIYTYPVTGESFDFRETLSAGLYYWKIESNDELLYVGKFFISPSSRLHPRQ
jgi:hypothetical protein